jgi:hypothetical protein
VKHWAKGLLSRPPAEVNDRISTTPAYGALRWRRSGLNGLRLVGSLNRVLAIRRPRSAPCDQDIPAALSKEKDPNRADKNDHQNVLTLARAGRSL